MAPTQKLSSQIILDGVLSGGYKDAFNSAGRLMSDLKRQSTDLRKQLGGLGKEADDIEKIGGAADEVCQSMKLLERQIDSTERATQKFGDARSHFRSASIGAKAFKSDIGEIADKAKMASLVIAGIGTAAAVALSPREELGVTLQNPEKDLISQPPVLNTETLQKDVILQPSVLNTETPEKDVILQPSALNTETPLKENITSPVIEQLRIPETTVVEMQAPAPDVSVTLPKPITNNEITVSPAEQLQSPTQDIISPPPVVNIRTDNPAINIPQTDVKNEIAPLVVNMPSSNPKIISPESLAIEQSTQKLIMKNTSGATCSGHFRT